MKLHLITALIFSLSTSLTSRIFPQESIETNLEILIPITSPLVNTLEIEQAPDSVLQTMIATSLTTNNEINPQITNQTITSIETSALSLPAATTTPQKPTHQASAVAQTLITIFSFLTSLLQSNQNQGNVAPSLSSLLESIFTLINQTSSKKNSELNTFIIDLKKECILSLDQTLKELSTMPESDDYKRPSRDEEKEAKTQAALCNVATIASGVASIVQNPHDKVNVGQNVGSILSGIIGIALLASHRSVQQSLLHSYNAQPIVLHRS